MSESIPPRRTLFARLRGWFFAGLLVTAPIFLTIYITWMVVSFLDSQIVSLLPGQLRDLFTTRIPGFGEVPGYGLIIGLVIITLVGALAAGFIGRWLIRMGESVLARMPIVRSIYSASKQVLETVMASQSDAFRDVVLVQYPRKGLWVIGFVTGNTKGEVQQRTHDDTVNVFVPTTPNPTSGFLLFCPRQELVFLDMSVDDALKLVVSGGIVTPPAPKAAPKAARKAAAAGRPAKKAAKKAPAKKAAKKVAKKAAAKKAPAKKAAKKA